MAAAVDDVAAELEHLIGFSCKYPNTCLTSPVDPSLSIYAAGNLVIFRDLNDPHQQDLLRFHDAEVCALAVSPGGEYVASGQICTPKGLGSPLVLWDVASRKRLFELQELTGDCQFIEFSPDTRLIAAGDDKGFYIWDLDTGDLILAQKAERGQQITTFTWGSIHEGRSKRNASYLISTASSNTILLHLLMFDVKSMHYILQTSNVALPSRGYVRRYTQALFSEDRNLLYAATTAGDIAVFNVPNAVFRISLNVGASGVFCLAARGPYVYAGAGDGSLKKFVMMDNQDTQWAQAAEGRLGGRILSLQLISSSSCTSSSSSSSDSDDQLLATTSAGKMYRIRASDLTAVEVAEAVIAPSLYAVFGSQRSDQMATLCSDGTLKVWDLNTYLASAWAPCPNAKPTSGSVLAFSPDEQSIITGYDDGRLSCYTVSGDPRSGQMAELWKIPEAHRGPVHCMAQTDKLLITGGSDGMTRVWLAGSRKFVTQLNAHAMKPVTGVSVDVKHGHLVHSCGLDRSVCIFDLKTEGRVVTHQLNEKLGNMTDLQQRSDSEQESITSTTDGRICFWDIDVQPEPVATLQDPSRARINSMRLAPHGRYLATACDDMTVKVYDIHSLGLVTVLHAHSGPVTSVGWSPDQRQLVSVAADGTIAIWNFYLD